MLICKQVSSQKCEIIMYITTSRTISIFVPSNTINRILSILIIKPGLNGKLLRSTSLLNDLFLDDLKR